MPRSILSLLLFLLLVSAGWSQEVTEEGTGSTKEQAKKEALADLSQNISVEVKSVQTQISELIGDNLCYDPIEITSSPAGCRKLCCRGC